MYATKTQKIGVNMIQKQQDTNKVFLVGLVAGTTAAHVIQAFAQYRLTVVGMQQIMESNERSNYCPTVQFTNKQHKMKALKLGKIKINDAICKIRQYRQMPASDIGDSATSVTIGTSGHPLLVAPPQQAKHRRQPPSAAATKPNVRNYSTSKPKATHNPPPGLHYPKETKVVPKPMEQYASMRELLKEFYFLSTICHELDDEMQNIILKKKDIIKKQCFLMEQLQKRQMYMHEEIFPPQRGGFDPKVRRIPQQMRSKIDQEQRNFDGVAMKARAPPTAPRAFSKQNSSFEPRAPPMAPRAFSNQNSSFAEADSYNENPKQQQHSGIMRRSGLPSKNENEHVPMCRYFLENRCVHGNNCQFSHDKKRAKYTFVENNFIENQQDESDSESIDFKKHLENRGHVQSSEHSRDQVVLMMHQDQNNDDKQNNLKKKKIQYTSEALLTMRKSNPSWYTLSENLPGWAPLKDENDSPNSDPNEPYPIQNPTILRKPGRFDPSQLQ
jgi:hypothetical protein